MVRRAFEKVEKEFESFDYRPLVDPLKRTGSAWPVALYVLGMAIVTSVSVLVATETAHQEIHDEIKEEISQ
ncbi:MAG TPA: hypothetical protein VF131_15225 [Blastocatellia bacterium]|nr:hypothetical protein [Blastocatellia bacterium]